VRERALVLVAATAADYSDSDSVVVVADTAATECSTFTYI